MKFIIFRKTEESILKKALLSDLQGRLRTCFKNTLLVFFKSKTRKSSIFVFSENKIDKVLFFRSARPYAEIEAASKEVLKQLLNRVQLPETIIC